MEINDLYLDIKDEIIQIRRKIHMYPEIEFDVFNTADTICTFLDKYSIVYERNIGTSGVCACVYGNRSGKTLLVRADMDALPVFEETDLEYKSVIDGKMHACGHDIHIANALACAYILSKSKDKFCGCVKFVFQPAEEGLGGAEPMIGAGVMESPKVDFAIATHVSPHTSTGKIELKCGGIMAAPDHFKFSIIGKSAHGAEPENGINPVFIGSEIVNSIKDAVLNNVETDESPVLSICFFNGGTTTNVIPDSVSIGGTFRCFDEDTRKKSCYLMENHIKDICGKYGAKYTFDYSFLYPPVINDENFTKKFASTAEDYIGKENVIWLKKPFMLGDDFSYFAQLVPSCYFRVGCKGNDVTYPLHSSRFNPDENSIEVASTIMSNFAIKFLN